MKFLLLFLGLSASAMAGPTIVESGGYTFLPALRLTSTLGLFAPQAGVTLQGTPPTVSGGAGLALGNVSSYAALCAAGLTYSLGGNCFLYTTGTDTFLNASTGNSVIIRINNSTKATFGTGALLLASGVDLQTVQGQKLTFDGATAAKYLSSNGTVLSLTGLPFLGVAGAEFDGDVSAYTTAAAGVTLGTASNFPGVWIIGGTTTPTTANYALLNAGPTILNGPSGQGLAFRENNGVLGSWTAAAGLVIGSGGTAISKSPAGTGTLDFASASQATCSADLTIAVTGATTTATVQLGVPNGSVAAGSMFFAWVSSADVVKVRHCCIGAATCDPASGTFSARTMNP